MSPRWWRGCVQCEASPNRSFCVSRLGPARNASLNVSGELLAREWRIEQRHFDLPNPPEIESRLGDLPRLSKPRGVNFVAGDGACELVDLMPHGGIEQHDGGQTMPDPGRGGCFADWRQSFDPKSTSGYFQIKGKIRPP